MKFVRIRLLIAGTSLGLLGSGTMSGLSTYCSYRAYRPDGDEGWLWAQILPLGAIVLSLLLVLLVSLIGLLFRSPRQTAIAGLACFLAGALALFVLPKGDSFRLRGMRTIAANSEPLLKAINAFHARHGAWPPKLTSLVPEFLPTIPPTGLAAYPEYEYVVGSQAVDSYLGNPWVLRVSTPTGGLNWDEFLYYPLQNYRIEGQGKGPEIIEGWLYLHE